MTVKRLLGILPKNRLICVSTEFNKRLYKGPAWALTNKYVLSLLVVDAALTVDELYVMIYVAEV